jgi:polyhydroxybutyrate depolymerase
LVLVVGLIAGLTVRLTFASPKAGAAPHPSAVTFPAPKAPTAVLPSTQVPSIVNPLEAADEDHVDRRFPWGGYIREYRYHLPSGQVPTQAAPIIVMLHGYLLDDAWAERTTGFDALADETGAIVVYPQGLADSWNAGGCCAQAQRLGSRDADFVHAIVADMAGRFEVDLHRVIIGGFSNGGMLAYQIACADANQLAGVLIVNGSREVMHCSPAGPVAMVVLHSRGDRTVPFNGQHHSKKLGVGTPSVAASLQPFVDVDGCTQVHVAVASPWESRLYRRCAGHSEITLLVNELLSHEYPKDHTLPKERSVADLVWSRLGTKVSVLPFAAPVSPIAQ